MQQANRTETLHAQRRVLAALVPVIVLIACSGPAEPAPNTPPPAASPILVVSPAAALLSEPNEKREFTVKAFNAQGKEISVDVLGLEWISSDPTKIAVASDAKSPDRATVTASSPVGFAVVSARVRANPVVVSNPVPVENVRLLPGVQTIADDRVVYPVPNLPPFELPETATLPDISPPDASGRVLIGGFSISEVSALLTVGGDPKDANNPPKLYQPLVIRGTPVPDVGAVLVASGGADVFDRVVKVETRGAFSLVQLEPVQPLDVYQNADLSVDLDQLVSSGVLIPETRDALVGEALLEDEATAAFQTQALSLDCKREGDRTLDDLGLSAKLNNVFKPTFSFKNTLGVDFANGRLTPGEIKATAGYTLDAQLSVSPKFQGSGEIKFECKLWPPKPKPQSVAAVKPQVLPILPVLAAGLRKLALHIVKNVRVKFSPKVVIGGSIKVKGDTQFTQVVDLKAAGSLEMGLRYDGQTVTPIYDAQGGAPTVKPSFNLQDDPRNSTRVKIESKLNGLYKVDFSLIYKPLEKAVEPAKKLIEQITTQADRLKKIIENNKFLPKWLQIDQKQVDDLIKQLNGLSESLKILTEGLKFGSAKAGAEMALDWSNALEVLSTRNQKDPDPSPSTSTVEQYLPVKLEFVPDQVNAFLEAFKLSKVPAWTPLDKKLFRSVFYRPLAAERLVVNSKAVIGGKPTVTARQDADLEISVLPKYADVPQSEFIGPDTPPDSGSVWLEAKDGLKFVDTVKLDYKGSLSLGAKFKVTKAMCESLKNSKQGGGVGTFLIAGFNKMLGVPTPGYVGSYNLACGSEDLVSFEANGVVFPEPNGGNVAIVGTVPDNTCQEAKNVAMRANVRDATGTVKFTDLVLKLDGQEIARAAGGTSDESVPLGTTVTRDLKVGSYTFTLEYTASDALNQQQTKSETFTAKAKRTDGTICGKSATYLISGVGDRSGRPAQVETGCILGWYIKRFDVLPGSVGVNIILAPGQETSIGHPSDGFWRDSPTVSKIRDC